MSKQNTDVISDGGFINKYLNSTVNLIHNTVISTAVGFTLDRFYNLGIRNPLIKMCFVKTTHQLYKFFINKYDDLYKYFISSENEKIVKINQECYDFQSFRYYSSTRDDSMKIPPEPEKPACVVNINKLRYTNLEGVTSEIANNPTPSDNDEITMVGLLTALATLATSIIIPHNSKAIGRIIFRVDQPSRLQQNIASGTIVFLVSDLIKLMDEEQKSMIVSLSKKVFDNFFEQTHQVKAEQELAGTCDIDAP